MVPVATLDLFKTAAEARYKIINTQTAVKRHKLNELNDKTQKLIYIPGQKDMINVMCIIIPGYKTRNPKPFSSDCLQLLYGLTFSLIYY